MFRKVDLHSSSALIQTYTYTPNPKPPKQAPGRLRIDDRAAWLHPGAECQHLSHRWRPAVPEPVWGSGLRFSV